MHHGHPTRLSRRTALRQWIAGSASLTLLTIGGVFSIGTSEAAPADQSGGPAPAQVPAQVPAASGSTAPSAPAATSPGPSSTVLTSMPWDIALPVGVEAGRGQGVHIATATSAGRER